MCAHASHLFHVAPGSSKQHHSNRAYIYLARARAVDALGQRSDLGMEGRVFVNRRRQGVGGDDPGRVCCGLPRGLSHCNVAPVSMWRPSHKKAPSRFAQLQSPGSGETGDGQVVGTAMRDGLGGDAADDVVLAWCLREFRNKHKMDPSESARRVRRCPRGASARRHGMRRGRAVGWQRKDGHEGASGGMLGTAAALGCALLPL